MASSASTTCLTQPDGEVYCWGENIGGAVGNGTTVSPVTTPTGVWGFACGSGTLPANSNLCLDDVGVRSTNDGSCSITSRPLPGTLCNGNILCKSANRCDGSGNCIQWTTWCDDLNKCTSDGCDNTSDSCTHGNVANDNNDCTNDSCNPDASGSGVSHSPVSPGKACGTPALHWAAATPVRS